MIEMDIEKFQFGRLDLHWKLMVTGFLVILGSGYIAAVFNAALSVGMTPQAIAEHYADKSLSAAEITIIDEQGFVEEEFSLDDSVSGEEAMGQDMPEEGHDMSQMEHEQQGDDTLPPQILAQVSHVHLLAFSLLFFVLASLLCLTQLRHKTKTAGVVVLFVGLWGDILSLNLVRFVSADFSWLTVSMGTLVGVSFAFIIFRVFWELWFTKTAV